MNQGKKPTTGQNDTGNTSKQNHPGTSQNGNQNRISNKLNDNNRGKLSSNSRSCYNKEGKKGKRRQSAKPAVPPRRFRKLPNVLGYIEGMNVVDIAREIHYKPTEIIKGLFVLGVMVDQNQALGKDMIELLIADCDIEPQEKVRVDITDIDKSFRSEEVDPDKLVSCPLVVTIIEHVDHGKITLLDTLRHSRVASGEAGRITQYIGTYRIGIDGKPITFLDIPGHAAFTSIRARGASTTDIIILVVAADDGVMPQTVGTINHAEAAGAPIIVAVDKIDKPDVNSQHVIQELNGYGLIPEAWGGETIFTEISAKLGQNTEELLEMILLVAEVEDLKANPTQRATGTAIEVRLDKGRGPVSTLLVQEGIPHVGGPIVVSNTYGRVRIMTNDLDRHDKETEPATPVEIIGLNDAPQAGDRFVIFGDEKTIHTTGEERVGRVLLENRATSNCVTLDNLFEGLKGSELKEISVVIKADVRDLVEALAALLKKIEVEGIRVKIVHSAVGTINESGVTSVAASSAIITGSNARPIPQARAQVEAGEVDIHLHRIIYKTIDETEAAMKGMLDPESEEETTGQVIAREAFKVFKVGIIVGAYITEGYIHRDSGIHVIRDGIIIYGDQLASLKRFKDDVKEVKMGHERSAIIERFSNIKVDDVIEGSAMEEVKND